MDSNHRRRKPADLQSAPFGHSGNFPFKYPLYFCLPEKAPFPNSPLPRHCEPMEGFEPTTS